MKAGWRVWSVLWLAGCSRPLAGTPPLPVAAPMPPALTAEPLASVQPGGAGSSTPANSQVAPLISWPVWRLEKTDPLAALSVALRRDAAGGVVRLPADPLASVNGSRTLQVKPSHSQERANERAQSWQADARQVYVAWGFMGLRSLSEVQHVHYSPAVRRSLVQIFRMQPWASRTHQEVSRRMDRGAPYLQGVQDDFGIDAHEAYAIARRAGYSGEGLTKAAVLIRPLVIGPVWAFLDSPVTQMTVLAVDAISGEVIRPGLKLDVIRYIVEPVPEDPPVILPSPEPIAPRST